MDCGFNILETQKFIYWELIEWTYCFTGIILWDEKFTNDSVLSFQKRKKNIVRKGHDNKNYTTYYLNTLIKMKKKYSNIG